MTKFKANHPTGSSVLTVEASVVRDAEGKIYVGFDNGYSYHHDWFDPEDAPAMMLAIAEAAGMEGDGDEHMGLQHVVVLLRRYLREKAEEDARIEHAAKVWDLAKRLYGRFDGDVPWGELPNAIRYQWRDVALAAMDELGKEE